MVEIGEACVAGREATHIMVVTIAGEKYRCLTCFNIRCWIGFGRLCVTVAIVVAEMKVESWSFQVASAESMGDSGCSRPLLEAVDSSFLVGGGNTGRADYGAFQLHSPCLNFADEVIHSPTVGFQTFGYFLLGFRHNQ